MTGLPELMPMGTARLMIPSFLAIKGMKVFDKLAHKIFA